MGKTGSRTGDAVAQPSEPAPFEQCVNFLIGCNFPEWLSRFFLRATSEGRLSQQGRREWLIEQPQPNEGLVYFLRSYSKDTEVLADIPPLEFIDKLHQRWVLEHGANKPGITSPTGEAVPPEPCLHQPFAQARPAARRGALWGTYPLGVAASEVWFTATR
jgi:hypothetical protein